MKKSIPNSLIILSIIVIFCCMFLCNETKSSSIRDNTSRGIILNGPARVKQIECVDAMGMKLPAANPATSVEYGFGAAIEFSDATIDSSLVRIRVPKDIDYTVQPMLQLEWSCPTADPTGDIVNVRWEITYTWLAIDETSDVTSGTTIANNYNVSETAKGLVETDIQLADFSSDDNFLYTKIVRRADATPDTADSAVVNLFDACLYYTKNKLGEPL
jgi:hypothetical protein